MTSNEEASETEHVDASTAASQGKSFFARIILFVGWAFVLIHVDKMRAYGNFFGCHSHVQVELASFALMIDDDGVMRSWPWAAGNFKSCGELSE